jgi:hypothetical protein
MAATKKRRRGCVKGQPKKPACKRRRARRKARKGFVGAVVGGLAKAGKLAAKGVEKVYKVAKPGCSVRDGRTVLKKTFHDSSTPVYRLNTCTYGLFIYVCYVFFNKLPDLAVG